MIKKVSSWVLGSFFRQFGRFLFFLVLGVLVVLLVQHNNINFKWTDLLGIQTVKALALDGTITGQYQLSDNQYTGSFYRTSGYNNTTGTYYFNSCKEPGNADYMVFTIQSLLYTDIDNTLHEHYGSGWTTAHSDAYPLYDRYIHEAKPRVQLMSTGVWPVCEIQNNLIVCPLFKNVCYTGLKMELLLPVGDENFDTTWDVTISNYANLMKTSTNSIIDNQNQNTQDINNTLTDTNTTSDISTADSFFNDTNSTSESAIADIVSTPLTLLNNLSVGSFNDICATLNNKQICLPSGDIIWNRQHGGAGVHDHWFRGGSTQAFITFFNLVVGGFILYKCLISLFHAVHKMLDPVNTYVEVMKL